MKNTKGFTLVELSIVLVIIGLIVGGVVGGQSLIKSARLNKVVTEVSSFKTALQAFELQYDALPGDTTDAYDYWGVAVGCTDNDIGITPFTGCNGNGNGQPTLKEGTLAWQHLALANIIPGSYVGSFSDSVGTFAGSYAELASGLPASAWGGYYNFVTVSSQTKFTLAAANEFFGPSTTSASGPLFTPAELKSLDKKMDDGIASTGLVRGVNGRIGSTAQACLSSGEYNLAITSTDCSLEYFLD
jgi:prepilin-type N-terminal cleavage/methylation domain-containing protein